jgi:hypothetical protein
MGFFLWSPELLAILAQAAAPYVRHRDGLPVLLPKNLLVVPVRLESTGGADSRLGYWSSRGHKRKRKVAPLWRMIPSFGLLAPTIRFHVVQAISSGRAISMDVGRQGAIVRECFW